MSMIDDNGVSSFVDDLGVTSWIDDLGQVLGGTSSGRVFTIHLVDTPPVTYATFNVATAVTLSGGNLVATNTGADCGRTGGQKHDGKNQRQVLLRDEIYGFYRLHYSHHGWYWNIGLDVCWHE